MRRDRARASADRRWTYHRIIDREMAAAGFQQWNTGGGCMGWGKSFPDHGHLLITAGNDDLYAPPAKRCWYIGESTAEEQAVRELYVGLNLDDVLEIARRWELHRWGWES
jgi:hypothetical protein